MNANFSLFVKQFKHSKSEENPIEIQCDIRIMKDIKTPVGPIYSYIMKGTMQSVQHALGDDGVGG